MTEPIRLLMASDLHFGCHHMDQGDMGNAFVRTIFPLLEETDIFFINGDFFDTLVNFDNHGFDPIYDTIMHLFRYCQRHNVVLRILQGTWTHDRNQCKRFNSFYRNGNHTFDFKVVYGIELEEITIRDRALRFLYVQDDLPYKVSDDVIEVIQAKMTELGWDYVDYGCMHGFFDFTFPSGISQENVMVFHGSQFGFVKKAINVGHVHQHRVKDNVISNGSFDRLGHNEEDPKGCVKIMDYPDHYTAQFVENKHAAYFNTLRIAKTLGTEEIITMISSHLEGLTTDRRIHLRFSFELPEHRDAIRAWMKEVHPEIAVKFTKSGDEKDKHFVLAPDVLFTPVQKRIAPTPATIANFIRADIPESYILPIEKIEQYLSRGQEKK